jgi:hypothetical protein
MNMKIRNIFTVLLSLSVITGSIYGITHVRDILDWAALRNYAPPARVVELANQTTMKPETRRIFYVNRPEIQDKQHFKTSCSQAEQTIVLGCFVSNKGIFLLNVEDPRLNGVVQVTAAHEVLHAHYDRLNGNERQRVDRMTSEFFASLKNDRIKKVVENYRKKDASIVPNELHSILATEVRDLSPDLEAYYSRYFTDRKALVTFSEKYEQTFVDLENQVLNYDQQLATLKKSIESNQQRLEGSEEQIDAEKRTLDGLLAAGRTEEYNGRVAGFNALVNQHNALIRQTQGLVEEYNNIVELRNALATTEAQLVEAIDANSLPQQQ